MKPIIKVVGLSKRYQLGTQAESFPTLRDSLVGMPRRVGKLFRRNGRAKNSTFWALRDVSFDVMPGEVVGVIGRNGAGKSTLLKILSRITEPTTGRIELYGRIASLLEVGTGFHPELSGRENIFLNGAILGMKKVEITRKFDEIVAFAEIDKFIDTPVKRYSSGMYVRLAFAVAASLEPEILVVDEVLAVGDTVFQKKCLGKMGEVAKGGRTVIFVSHNMGAVVSLCKRCVLMEKGSVALDGAASEVADYYQASLHSMVQDATDLSRAERYGTGRARFVSATVTALNGQGEPQPFLRTGGDLEIEARIVASSDVADANMALIIYDSSGYRLIDANTALQGSFLNMKAGDEATVGFRLRNLLLKPGVYFVGLWLGRGSVEDIDGITYMATLTVEADPEAVMHTETFPGVYQCQYQHRIEINGGAQQTATRAV